jgi:hypothetical protein
MAMVAAACGSRIDGGPACATTDAFIVSVFDASTCQRICDATVRQMTGGATTTLGWPPATPENCYAYTGAVPPGTYVFSVTKAGYETATRTENIVQVSACEIRTDPEPVFDVWLTPSGRTASPSCDGGGLVASGAGDAASE